MILALALITGLIATVLVLLPFVVGPGGQLAAASFEVSSEKLQEQKKAIIERFLKEESSFKNGFISRRTWAARQQFLTNKYLDASRRLDFLEYCLRNENHAPEAKT
jgi:hypothetical protein